MLEIYKFPSEGGVRVRGRLMDMEPFEIERLSALGETVVRSPGIEMSYDIQGKLVLAVVKVTEYVLSQRKVYKSEFPKEYLEMIYRLAENGIEIMAEIDLVTKIVTLVERRLVGEDNREDPDQNQYTRKQLTTYDLNFYNGRLYPVEIGEPGAEYQEMIGIQPELRDSDNRIILGVGDNDKVSWVAHPIRMDMSLLSGDLETNIVGFLRGKKE